MILKTISGGMSKSATVQRGYIEIVSFGTSYQINVKNRVSSYNYIKIGVNLPGIAASPCKHTIEQSVSNPM